MPCYRTLFVRNKIEQPVQVPCGQCLGCRLEYSRSWAVRCTHESQMHDENCFITLTYNEENLPEHGSLDKKHMQDFMKRLRNRFPERSIRFYGCGEYGNTGDRPHYHILLFGCDFQDKEPWRKSTAKWSNYQNTIFRSKILEELWQKGFSEIGTVTFQSAGYVARYCVKKQKGKKASEHYGKRIPEFSLMSRRPGIGRPWIDKYIGDVYPKDYFHLNDKKQKPPRYYDSVLEKYNENMYHDVKAKRYQQAKDPVLKKMQQQYRESFIHGKGDKQILQKILEYIEGKETEKSLRNQGKELHKILTTKQLIREYENG